MSQGTLTKTLQAGRVPDRLQATAWILYGDGQGEFATTELVVGHGWRGPLWRPGR